MEDRDEAAQEHDSRPKEERPVVLDLQALRAWRDTDPPIADLAVVAMREQRPQTRGDCIDGPRPCPWISCKWHALLDVRHTGSITLNYPHLVHDRVYSGPLLYDGDFFADGRGRVVEGPHLDEMAHTCTLDVADQGSHKLIEVGRVIAVTRERARQIEAAIKGKLRVHRNVIEMWGRDDDQDAQDATEERRATG